MLFLRIFRFCFNSIFFQVVHISLKLARICQMRKEYDKAEIGYRWCLETIEKQNNKMLKGAILDWYSNFLAVKGDYKSSLKYLEEAYNISSEINGDNEKSVLLLNDIATMNYQLGNFEVANSRLEEALKLGKRLDNFSELGTLYANYGLIKIKLGLMSEAKYFCKEGWRLGKKNDNSDSISQANYCFEQLNNVK